MGQSSGRWWSAARPGATDADRTSRAHADAELLRGSRRDPELFGRFFDRYYDDVMRYFWLRTADAEVAADLTAETFAGALAGLERFDANRGAPAAWLFGIADKQMRQLLRRGRVDKRARTRVRLDPVQYDESGFERVEALRDIRAMVVPLANAMAALPEPIRRAIELRVLDELDYAVVAEKLGCSEGAARVRVSRGLKQILGAVVTDADR